jgi:hypothetical protein
MGIAGWGKPGGTQTTNLSIAPSPGKVGFGAILLKNGLADAV